MKEIKNVRFYFILFLRGKYFNSGKIPDGIQNYFFSKKNVNPNFNNNNSQWRTQYQSQTMKFFKQHCSKLNFLFILFLNLKSKIGTSLVLYSGCKDKVSNLTTHHAMRCVDKWTQRISRYMVPCSLMFSGFSISKYCRQNYFFIFR